MSRPSTKGTSLVLLARVALDPNTASRVTRDARRVAHSTSAEMRALQKELRTLTPRNMIRQTVRTADRIEPALAEAEWTAVDDSHRQPEIHMHNGEFEVRQNRFARAYCEALRELIAELRAQRNEPGDQ